VTGGNHWAKLLFGSTTLDISTSESTKIVTDQGKTTSLGSIKSGDRALAVYRVCKADVTGTTLTAKSLATTLTSLKASRVIKLGTESNSG
jgi:hypothetical protein